MSPTTKRRILLAALVVAPLIAIVFALAGCATNDVGWELKPDVPPLPAYFVDSTAAEIAQRCPPPARQTTLGCAARHYDIGKCFIYVEPDVPKWLATHELTHCAGFNHQ